ncbi:hypothetical protein ABKN59_002137 [Abortiporus biennis]
MLQTCCRTITIRGATLEDQLADQLETLTFLLPQIRWIDSSKCENYGFYRFELFLPGLSASDSCSPAGGDAHHTLNVDLVKCAKHNLLTFQKILPTQILGVVTAPTN